MRKRTICLLALLFVFSLFLISQNREPIKAFATDIMSRESFLAMTPYGVAEAHDTDTTLRKAPAIYWGYCIDGSVTFSDCTYQNAYNASCVPAIMLGVVSSDDTSTTLFTTHIKTQNYTGFTYEVRQSLNDTESDVTTTTGVYWVAFGWR